MSELITIAKPGEGKIRILAEHLPAHEKLGWTRDFADDEGVVTEDFTKPRRGRPPAARS